VVLARSREERERTAVLVVVVDLDRVVERRDAESRRAMISDVDVVVIGNIIIIEFATNYANRLSKRIMYLCFYFFNIQCSLL
jgi:hypothetical protein